MSKVKGMGGHMTAALLHEIDMLYRIYDAKIQDAFAHNHNVTADDLAKQRDRKIRQIADRLAERGYTYVMRDRPAVKPRLVLNEGEKALARGLLFASLMRDAA